MTLNQIFKVDIAYVRGIIMNKSHLQYRMLQKCICSVRLTFRYCEISLRSWIPAFCHRQLYWSKRKKKLETWKKIEFNRSTTHLTGGGALEWSVWETNLDLTVQKQNKADYTKQCKTWNCQKKNFNVRYSKAKPMQSLHDARPSDASSFIGAKSVVMIYCHKRSFPELFA